MFSRPVLTIAVVWAIGNMYAFYYSVSWVVFIVLCLGFLVIVTLWSPKKVFRSFLFICLFLCSILYFQWTEQRHETKISENFEEQAVQILGFVHGPAKVDGDQGSFVVYAESLQCQDDIILLGEKMQVFIRLQQQEQQEQIVHLLRGERVLIEGIMQLPSLPSHFDQFHYRKYLKMQHIHWIVSVSDLTHITLLQNEESTSLSVHFLRWMDQLRVKLSDQINRLFGEHAGLLQAMLIGMKDDVPVETMDHFIRLGLAHLLAISGLHIGVFVSVCLLALRWVRVPREHALTCCMILIPFYVLLTGAAPSTLRAGIMSLIGLYAWKKNWLKHGLETIAIAFIILIVWNPYYLWNVGFQLSFSITAGLILSIRSLTQQIPVRNQVIRSNLALTTAAEWVSFPLSIFYFNQYSFLSWVTNLIIVPLISVIVYPLSGFTLIVSFIVPNLSKWLAFCIHLLLDGVIWVVEMLTEWKFFLFVWASPPLWWMALYYALIIGTVHLWNRVSVELPKLKKKTWMENMARSLHVYYKAIPVCAFIFMFMIAYHLPKWEQHGIGTVHFLDVGQGDAILIQTPSNRTILIDGGGTFQFSRPGEEWKVRKDPYEVGRKTVVPLLKKRGIQYLNYVVISHAHLDHFGGLQAVIEEIPVGAVLFNGTYTEDERYGQLLQTILKKKIPMFSVEAGHTWQVDDDTTVKVHAPFLDNRDTIHLNNNQNEMSVTLEVEMHEVIFWLTGDLYEAGERNVIKQMTDEDKERIDQSVNILKVAHHGSNSSTSYPWLKVLKPTYAVISLGKNNRYGHPHQLVLQRAERVNSIIYRTDQHGEIQFRVKRGGDVSVRSVH